MTFATYQDLLDAARKHDGMWQTITSSVAKAATQSYKEKHCGRYNARGIEKEEGFIQGHFLSMFNLCATDARTLNEVATIVLDSHEYLAVAWAVAQRLKGKA